MIEWQKNYLCNIRLPGETAEVVARATASQYDKEQIEIVRIPYIDSESQIDEVIDDAKRGNHVICHTIVSETLRKYLHEKWRNTIFLLSILWAQFSML